MTTNAISASVQSNLIPVFTGQIGGAIVQLVNARDLHAFLQVGRDFTNWVKARISRYGFLENHDFMVFANSGVNPQGGRPTAEYHLTLDTAKELAMVENNDQGRAARRYFIECERALYARQHRLQDADRVQLATLLAGEVATVASRTVFEAVLAGDDGWKHRRWMFALSHGMDGQLNRPWAGPIAHGVLMLTADQLAAAIADGDGVLLTNRQLASLAAACTSRLAFRIESQARALANENA